ncbi:DUF2637 domain-containing protein [Microtetraspora fusca]|uniref:DUF2637 domain-containing protein n=1 Tax=Microtetraspora fusca TaxID=1997 RepID=UPI0009FBC70A|nr:DUF2637 domain-containing protein [Microtetraspora fusca]
MDASPPTAAGTASRPPGSPSPGLPLALRRVAVAIAALAVALLATAACVLSFDDMRALALAGQAEPRFVYFYPAAFDALLAVALISVPLVRTGRPILRVQAGFILTLLMAAAATATAATSTGATPDPRQAAIVVALLPWVMLSIGLWLLLLLAKQAQAYWSERDSATDAAEIVPFAGDDRPHTVETPAAAHAPEPPTPQPEPTAPEPARQEPAEPPAAPATGQTPETDAPVRQEPSAASHHDEPAAQDAAEAEPAGDRPNRPLRWGDLVRPHAGDVLVHPLPLTTPEETPEEPEQPEQAAQDAHDEARAAEADVDTQPLRVISDVPDPAHDSDAADEEETRQAGRPYGTAGEAGDEPMPADPPSRHMRSTPLPPE